MISPGVDALLAGAGVLAGLVGSAGGITSLVSYPALLAAGLAPLPANIANIVALLPYLPGSALASRPELKGRSSWLRRWVVLAALGGAGGAALLLTTPPGVFSRIVPFLVLGASVALFLQPRLRQLHESSQGSSGTIAALGALLAVQVYGGYFGAGSGVMTLTLILVVVEPHLARANALKNILVGTSAVASAVVLVVVERIPWGYVVPLGCGVFVGSCLGPVVARRIRPDVLRWIVGFVGIGLAVKLWITSS